MIRAFIVAEKTLKPQIYFRKNNFTLMSADKNCFTDTPLLI